MFDKIRLLLDRYEPISLEEVETVKLMNRVDTKYVVAVETVERLLAELADDYLVLEIDSQRFGQYRSVYYDTPDLQMFHTHITSRYPRFKVRDKELFAKRAAIPGSET